MAQQTSQKPRARDLGVPFIGTPGPLNAITDVPGVRVGQTTLISGEGDLVIGKGPVRTGVTVIFPRPDYAPVYAAWDTLNGCGELTGTTWVQESGFLGGPIGITGTFNVGTVHTSIIQWCFKKRMTDPAASNLAVGLPMVGETWDGELHDVAGFHLKPEHVFAALDGARTGPVPEGGVGGGTGMICHAFKGGTGTASRVVQIPGYSRTYTLGVLVQANHGGRERLSIAGVPVGQEIPDLMPEVSEKPNISPSSSIIVVVGTDCPLLPNALKRIAGRVALGIGRLGAVGGNSSGDIFVAFSTASPDEVRHTPVSGLEIASLNDINMLFVATVDATEEAIVNCLVAGETMVGVNGNKVYGLPHERLRAALKKYNRLVE
jgi:L-aminopeptidase/D-esterase-like protein